MAAGGMGKGALKLLQNAAKNKQVRATAVRLAPEAIPWTAKKVRNAGSRPFRAYQHCRMAVAHALQVQGHYSRGTIVLGKRRYVVWKDGVPVECYPRPTSQELPDIQKLKDLPELQDFNPDLFVDPKKDSA